MTPSSHSQDCVNKLSPKFFNILCVSRSPLPGKTLLISVALLGLVREQVMVRRDGEAGKGKEEEIGVETFAKVQLRSCPFKWYKGTNYKDLMKCKSDGVELLGKCL